MPEKNKYYLVEASVLPDVFLKVVHAKQLLALGKASNLSKAAQLAGISRSALYKYKDAVHLYDGNATQNMATIYVELVDEPGILSSLLGQLYSHGVNILTINQNIPVDGVAPVSISMRTDRMTGDTATLLESLEQLEGVVAIRLLAN